MAALCCSTARFSPSLPRLGYGAVSSITVSRPQPRLRLGFSFRGAKRLEVRRSVLVSCLGDAKTAVVVGKSWDKLILDCDKPVLVEFYTSWCGPCQMVHPVIEEIATDYSGRLKCFVLDTDNDLQVARKYGIKAVPVVLLFKNGEKRDSVIGPMPKDFYVAAIERVLAS